MENGIRSRERSTLPPAFLQLAAQVTATVLRSHPGLEIGTSPDSRIVRLTHGPRALPPPPPAACEGGMALHLVDVVLRMNGEDALYGIANLGWHRSAQDVLDSAVEHLLQSLPVRFAGPDDPVVQRRIVGRIDLCDCCYGTGRHPVFQPDRPPEACLLCSGTGEKIVPDDVWRSFLRSMRHGHHDPVGGDAPTPVLEWPR